MMLKQFAATGVSFHDATSSKPSSVCDTITQLPLKTFDQGSSLNWFRKTLFIGGSIIVLSYAGYRFWKYLVKDDNNDMDGEVNGNPTLPEGSLWSDVAGDAWAREDVPLDPVYGLPPWMANKMHVECDNASVMTDVLSLDPDFSVPTGASWADICPQEVEEVEVDPVYRLPLDVEQEEKFEAKAQMNYWGLDIIQEEEEEEE